MRSPFLFALFFIFSLPAQSQIIVKEHALSASSAIEKDSLPAAYRVGVEIQASVLPKGNINTTAGSYQLQSRLQSSLSLGVSYERILDKTFRISYGLQLNLTNSNYYLHIPDSQLPGYLSTGGAPQVEDKQAYFKLSLPVWTSYHFIQSKSGSYAIAAGLKLNYSGFSNDEKVITQMADTNYQLHTVFVGDFKSDNNKKPWVTFMGAITRNVNLKNTAVLSIQLFAEFGKTKFIKGNYQITVPNQPTTTGVYSAPSTSLGIGVQYSVARYRKERKL